MEKAGTSVNDVVVVQVIDSFQYLSNGLGSVLLGELALLADAVEQLTARGQLGYDVVFVLLGSAVVWVVPCLLVPHPRLEPVVELDNVRVLHALKHLELVIDHLLVPTHVLLQDDLDRNLSLGAVGLPNDTVGAGTQRLSEAIAGPGAWVSMWAAHSLGRGSATRRERGTRTCGHSCRAGRAACSACLSLWAWLEAGRDG